MRDAGLLSRVSHITSVSGGSIMAAHLVLNWQRYTGSEQDCDDAANELLDFIRLDVRNRIVRRFPLAFVANGFRWLIGKGRARKLTRPGLLEALYEESLFGDKCLYELPAVPQLHILATNLNEGCLCSFTRRGILFQRRMPDGTTRFELTPSALATIPMAVTASSAFPGFFPPLQLTAADVGADETRFPPHLFTDGGVYDNLGVRMFRHIQESWIGHDSPLCSEDFVDLPGAVAAMQQAGASGEDTPLSHLAHLILRRAGSTESPVISRENLPQVLWNVLVHDHLYLNPSFGSLETHDEQAANLRHLASHGRKLDQGDHLWLNRYLANAAYKQITGNDLLQTVNVDFDAVIVSDAGKQFAVSRRTKGGGLLGTALRSTDIVMDRVWQLEVDQFSGEPDFVFASMHSTVYPSDDPQTIHPEIQKQVTNTRTDLDRFSDLEISALVRHGYSVMRKVCRGRPNLFGDQFPSGPPWDPNSRPADGVSRSARSTGLITQQARQLQASSQRIIFSRLVSLRDWPTYVYIPLLAALMLGLPYFGYQAYKTASRSEMIVNAITFSNPDFQLVLQLARQNPIPGEWTSLTAEEVSELEPMNLDGFQLVTDTRIIDMRAWQPGVNDKAHGFISYRRMKIRRIAPSAENGAVERSQTDNKFRIQQFGLTRNVSVRCDATDLKPVLRVAPHVSSSGQAGFLYELEFDLSSVPEGRDFELGFEVTEIGLQGRLDSEDKLIFPIIAPTDVATLWALLPTGHPYRDFEVIGYDAQTPASVEAIDPTYEFRMADGSLFGWMLVAPRDHHKYECCWTWRSN